MSDSRKDTHPGPAVNWAEVCSCGHHRDQHASPSTGDTRCLAVVIAGPGRFDDGRDGPGPCECLDFRPIGAARPRP